MDFYVFLGRYWGGQIWGRILEKTRVGFGRTELSLSAIGTTLCALSFEHGPRGLGFQGGSSGVGFYVFLARYWGVKNGKKHEHAG